MRSEKPDLEFQLGSLYNLRTDKHRKGTYISTPLRYDVNSTICNKKKKYLFSEKIITQFSLEKKIRTIQFGDFTKLQRVDKVL